MEVGWECRVEPGQRLLMSATQPPVDVSNPAPVDVSRTSRSALTPLRLHRLLCSNRGACVRALVFINPGNPTGQCLTEVRWVGAWYQCASLLPCPSVRGHP